MAKKNDVRVWIECLLRTGVVVLLLSAGIGKWIMGAGASAKMIQGMFAGTGFPHWIVLLYSWAIPYIEVVLGGWLVLGLRLRTAWIAVALFMISLGFGALITPAQNLAVMNFLLVLLAVAGIQYAEPGHAKWGLGWLHRHR